MTTPLIKNIDSPVSKYLVFTSAGDKANLRCWLKGERNFDLWISYYGEKTERYKDLCDFYIEKKGGKFPNLKYIYQHWAGILKHYEAIAVMDDDLLIEGADISRLFEIREQYNLWLLQPSFNPKGKINHTITRVKPFSFLRYTNFVEVTSPFFRRDKLDDFMTVYDPVLIGWGVDWWFIDRLSPGIEGRVAIIDDISCINPHDSMKAGQREIDLLQDRKARIENWRKIKARHRIQDREKNEFNSIKKPLTVSNVRDAILISAMVIYSKCVKLVRKVKKHLV